MVQALQGDCIAAAFLANAITSTSGGVIQLLVRRRWHLLIGRSGQKRSVMSWLLCERLEVISEPVPRPPNVTLGEDEVAVQDEVRCKMVNIVKYKARLVGQGYSQIFGKGLL
jgi:hypothetical protein